MIYTLTTNPAIDMNINSDTLYKNTVTRTRDAVYSPNGKGLNVSFTLQHFGVESTVLDMTGSAPCILRPGAVTREMVAKVLGSCTVADSVMRPLKEGEAAPSPGMKHRHYAPKASMTVYVGNHDQVIAEICRRYDENENTVILAMENAIPSFGARHTLSIGASPEETAHLLFRRLRETDEMGVSLVLAQGWEGEEMVLAVMNRMARAAAFDVVKL